jgi:hypothetical protein
LERRRLAAAGTAAHANDAGCTVKAHKTRRGALRPTAAGRRRSKARIAFVLSGLEREVADRDWCSVN